MGGAEREAEPDQQLEEEEGHSPDLNTDHVTEELSRVTDGEPDSIVADSALSEERDTITDLPSAPSPHPGKGRRLRSETESRSSKVPLLSFKGRKRSHTLQDGGVPKEKEEEEVRER